MPAYYNDNQRQAVKEAGLLAGLDVKRIVNEPTAAALAYGFNRGLDQKVLVYDLGGGTFDVSVLQLKRNVFEVVATGGDTFLGGVDFDNRIIDFVLEQFWREHKVDLAADAHRDAAGEERRRGGEDRPLAHPQRGHRAALRRGAERQAAGPPDAALAGAAERAHQRPGGPQLPALRRGAGAEGHRPRSIDEIILVGGQSRMPLVQQRIREHFGKPPRKGVHPDECVALGAALLGDSLDSIDSVTLVDVLSMPIGFAAPNGRLRRMLEKNQPIPATRASGCRRPASPGKPIEIDIYQGDSDHIVDNEFLGTLRLPAAATGRRIDFKLDEECLLRVSFDDPERGMVEVPFATRDTPEALRRAIAEKTPPPGAAGAAPREHRRGIFGWLTRS